MAEADIQPIAPLVYLPVIKAALAEDLGLAGDITSKAVLPPDLQLQASFRARRPGRLAGVAIALAVFDQLDPAVEAGIRCADGMDIEAGGEIAVVAGPAQAILSGERTALNILARLSGIATATRTAIRTIAPHQTRIACTRKTAPGLRALEKYAVRAGGGVNHRFGLFDGILIKDNHIAAAGGIGEAIERARAAHGHMVKIEVEVDTFEQLAVALNTRADAVLLDNMTPEEVTEAVKQVAGRMITEASGGLRPDNIRDYAAAGVDIISLGWLTHSAPALDIGLDIETVS